MKVVCAWCQGAGTARVLSEKEPQDDPTISHGICDDHARVMLAEVRRSTSTERWMELRRAS